MKVSPYGVPMSSYPTHRSGRTSRMMAAAYLQALADAKDVKAGIQLDPGLHRVSVVLLNDAEVSRWTQVLQAAFGGPLPGCLKLVSYASPHRAAGNWREFTDHAVKYKEYLDRGVQPWEMHLQSNYADYVTYDAKDSALEPNGPVRLAKVYGSDQYPAIDAAVMQMRVLEGYSTGCDSEEHF